jgi:hypothetical protein
VISGQAPISTTRETVVEITLMDLVVIDPDNDYPTDFSLAVRDGPDYLRVGNSITPAVGFTGVLEVAATVSDSSGEANAESDIVNLIVVVTDLPSGFDQDPLSGLVSIEVEHFDSVTSAGGHDWVTVEFDGASGSASLQSLPNDGASINTDFETSSPRLDFLVDFALDGRHFIWLRGIGASGTDDSAHVGLDGAGQQSSDRMSRFSNTWQWSKATMDGKRAFLDVPSAGEHVLNIWMREDGFVLDKVVLTTDRTYRPEGLGPDESPR